MKKQYIAPKTDMLHTMCAVSFLAGSDGKNTDTETGDSSTQKGEGGEIKKDETGDIEQHSKPHAWSTWDD